MRTWIMRTWVLLPFVIAVVLSGAPLTGQEAQDSPRCVDEEKWLACFTRYVAQTANERRTANQEDGDREEAKAQPLAKAQAQDDLVTEMASDDRTSKRNFLSMLLASVAQDNFEDADGELRLAYNFGPDAFGGKGIAGLTFEMVAKEPKVSDQLVEQIPEDLRAGQKEILEEGIEDFDDLETRLHISFLGGIGGTSWGQRAVSEYSEKLFQAVVGNLNHEIHEREKEALRDFTRLQATPGAPSLGANVSELRASNPTKADEFERTLLTAATAVFERHRSVRDLLSEKDYYRLGDLVANQPQLYLTLSTKSRDDLVGPDEKSAKLSYEFGTGNFNGLMSGCKDKAPGAPTLTCYSTFLEETRELRRKPLRLKLEAEYLEVDSYDFEVMLPGMMDEDGGAEGDEMEPAPTARLALDRVQKLVAALTVSKVLKLTDDSEDAKAQLKLDLNSKYEDISDDPMRQDRWVSTLTLSQRVSEEASLAVSLVYANKPEFRGMVDEELSARAGLNFEIDRGTKD